MKNRLSTKRLHKNLTAGYHACVSQACTVPPSGTLWVERCEWRNISLCCYAQKASPPFAPHLSFVLCQRYCRTRKCALNCCCSKRNMIMTLKIQTTVMPNVPDLSPRELSPAENEHDHNTAHIHTHLHHHSARKNMTGNTVQPALLSTSSERKSKCRGKKQCGGSSRMNKVHHTLDKKQCNTSEITKHFEAEAGPERSTRAATPHDNRTSPHARVLCAASSDVRMKTPRWLNSRAPNLSAVGLTGILPCTQ